MQYGNVVDPPVSDEIDTMFKSYYVVWKPLNWEFGNL